jgi:phosphate-selective porin
MYVRGARLRRGAELTWLVRSFSIKGEFMDVREQRLGQGLRGEDLPALRTDGWYLSVTHPLFGHLDNGSPGNFLRSIIPGKGLGLFEVTARYETIRFSSEHSGESLPSRSPRASNVLGNDDRTWTFGINWHLNRYLKLQLNAQREDLRDPVRTPLDGENRYWTQVGRFQLFF